MIWIDNSESLAYVDWQSTYRDVANILQMQGICIQITLQLDLGDYFYHLPSTLVISDMDGRRAQINLCMD